VFGLSSEKFLILAVIAVIVLGPKRLPEYAKQLANFVKAARRMADGAKSQLKEELGPEFEEVDWRKLDPRQYDPRRIIREALQDDFVSTESDLTKLTPASPAGVAATAAIVTLGLGEAAPFDTEAT
jgi:sec-independent protein translocase protein TatB